LKVARRITLFSSSFYDEKTLYASFSPWKQKMYSKLFFDKDPENPVHVEKLLKHFERRVIISN
jgi:hypothetical protein